MMMQKMLVFRPAVEKHRGVTELKNSELLILEFFYPSTAVNLPQSIMLPTPRFSSRGAQSGSSCLSTVLNYNLSYKCKLCLRFGLRFVKETLLNISVWSLFWLLWCFSNSLNSNLRCLNISHKMSMCSNAWLSKWSLYDKFTKEIVNIRAAVISRLVTIMLTNKIVDN